MELKIFNLKNYKNALLKSGLNKSEITEKFKNIEVILVKEVMSHGRIKVGMAIPIKGISKDNMVILEDGYEYYMENFVKSEYSIQEMELFTDLFKSMYSDSKEIVGGMKDRNEVKVKLFDSIIEIVIKKIKESKLETCVSILKSFILS